MIRISLVAVPRRAHLFLCKAAAVVATALAAATVCTLACYLVGANFFSANHYAIGITSPGVAQHLVGAIVCLAGWAMIGFAFGMLLRSTALGVTLASALYIAAPLLAENFAPDRANNVTPTQAGQALWIYHNPMNPDIAPFGTALAVFLVYVVVLVGAAFARVAFTDA